MLALSPLPGCLPALLPNCSGPALAAAPEAGPTSITASVATPAGPVQGTDYDGVRVEACPPGASPTCVGADCASLASCTVDGLATGTTYTVTAQLLKGTTPVSGKGASQAATPLHP